jgi:hypothetical protein
MRKLLLALIFLLSATSAWADSQPVTGSAGTSANQSGTVATGGTFQTAAISAASRKSLSFQNICNKAGNCSAVGDLCYLYMEDSGTPTTANSLIVQPGQEYLRSVGQVPQASIQVTCDNSNDKFRLVTQ